MKIADSADGNAGVQADDGHAEPCRSPWENFKASGVSGYADVDSAGITTVIIGSLLLGFSNLCFIDWIGPRSLFPGIWAECLSRSFFAPRSTPGYVFEHIPSLIVATLRIVLVVMAARVHSPASAIKSCAELSEGTPE